MDWLRNLTESEIMDAFPRTPWKHQFNAIAEGVATGCRKSRAINITASTGAGKSLVVTALLNLCLHYETPVTVYTNRRLLTRQLCSGLERDGLEFGVRAASMRHRYDPSKLVQVSSIMTEIKRVVETKSWELHKSGLVLVDESHLLASGASLRILQQHLSQGAILVGFTATPLGISHLYPFNYIAAKNSDLFACGALVKAKTYMPHQMDLSKVSRQKTGEYAIGDIRKSVWSQQIVGFVYKDWRRLNPDARQTICFAPGVPESLYLAQRFKQKGVKALHIDAKNIWVDGEMYTEDEQGTVRAQVLKDWDSGEFPIVFNRFVMREGLDFPNIYHGIFATPMGLKSWIQAVGRVLRRSEATKDGVIITDHANNYAQHGSPNTDWPWEDWYEKDEAQIADARKKKMQSNPDLEPIICSECNMSRLSGNKCPGCGYEGTSRTRVVIEQSGQLRKVDEPFFPAPKPRTEKDFFQSKWDQVYWRCRKSGRTFKQALVLFNKEHGLYPPKNLANMPISDIDWDRKIEAVPHMNLRREAERV